jgi:hypothetical protein
MLLALLAAAAVSDAQTPVAELSVHAGAYERHDLPVAAAISGLALQSHPDAVKLYEVTENGVVPVASQLKPGNPDQLTWIVAGRTAAGAIRNYQLRYQDGGASSAMTGAGGSGGVNVADSGESLRVTIDGVAVLEYRYALMPAPEGVDPVYSLSGFIHPLWSPQGEVITRIQPPDHYHHYGIWNPWTQTEFEGRTVDFWNIGSRQGRVVASGVLARTSGDVFGGFRSLHDHIAHSTDAGDRIALREEVDVTVWNVGRDAWVIDFMSTLNPATDRGITIKAYRYQGFSLRATERWNDRTARLLTSAGLDKSNANTTRARWLDVNGVSAARQGNSGVLLMTNPSNFNFPEQLRIWPTGQEPSDQNVFINFNPAQDRDWVLEPGKSYGLKYRMFVYDGSITAEEAERLWSSYANPPRVDVRVVGNLP